MSGIYDETVFDDLPDDDLDEPEDGRYGTPEYGSSDSPETMNRIDPLRRHTYLVEELDEPANDDDAATDDPDAEWDADEDTDGEGGGRDD